MQQRFAEYLVFGGPEGPMTKREAAIAAGYSKDRAMRRIGAHKPQMLTTCSQVYR